MDSPNKWGFSSRGHFAKSAIALASIVALAGCAGGGTATPGSDNDSTNEETVIETNEEIVIGALLGMTGIAPIIGEAARIATALAVDEINADGGIDGRQIKLVIADTESDPTTATLEFERLVNSAGAEVVIGPMFSSESFAVLPEIGAAGIFNIHMTATNDITPEFAPTSFGALMSAQDQASKMAQYALSEYQPKTVAILHDPGAQTIAAVETLKEELAAVSNVVTVETVFGATDMTPFMLQATRDNPDVIILFASTGGDLGRVLEARDALGFHSIPVVASNVAGSQMGAALDAVGGDESLFEGVTGLAVSGFATCDDVASGPPIEFQNALQESIGTDSTAKLGLPYASLYYDAVYIMKAAIEGSGGSTDGATLMEWMYTDLGGFNGIASGLSVSPDSHFMVGPDAMRVVEALPLLDGGMQRQADCK